VNGTIRSAAMAEWRAIERLIGQAALPTDDLSESACSYFKVYAEGSQIKGAIALEPLTERCAMLRSLAVIPSARGTGIGRALVANVEAQARSQNVAEVFLLTTSADRFFAQLGYERLNRDAAPDSVRSHEQFRALCPASAVLIEQENPGLTMTRPYHVLFLCTGNSARSILAEALVNKWGAGKFMGHSAGSHPKGAVHPLAIELLQESGFNTRGLRSKSWDEFATADAPHLDFVFTVCDNAAGELCPVWPGHPVTAHWGVEDPAAVEGSEAERRRAFRRAFLALEARIKVFSSLSIEALDRVRLKEQLDRIGKTAIGTSAEPAN
jgi:arsenate reductase (thioredoxin)